MNYALAREIYGGDCMAILPGMVDPLLESARKGEYDQAKRLNTSALMSSLTGETLASGAGADSKTGKLISETNLNGVMIKSGGASSRGTKEISADLLNADKDPDVIGHFFQIDGPGGSALAMHHMIGTLAQLTKPKVGMVERSGMAASAHFGVLSHMDYVMAEDGDSEVGCVGVICGATGHANGAVDGDGAKHFMVYGPKSIHKNEAEEKAINEGDITLLKERAAKGEDKFHALISAKRPAMTAEQMTGKMYPASEVIGTMVDAIGTKQDAISKIIELSKISTNKLTLKNSTAMTTAELKAQHPNTYNEILGIGVAAGVEAEKDRAGSWLAHLTTDPETVKKGIESGKEITGTARETLLVKANATAALAGLQKDSAGKLIVPESTTTAAEPTEAEAFYAPIMAKLKAK